MPLALATKIYRPEGVSVANRTPASVANMDCWHWGTDMRVLGMTMADDLSNRKALRDGRFSITASKRQGHFVLTAWPLNV